jgi:drug/metabolite transporter (DMT)-like permease
MAARTTEGYMNTMLAYAAIYLIWGSTYLAIRVAVGAIPPLLLMGVRCATAGVLLLAWAVVRASAPTSGSGAMRPWPAR